MTHVLIVGTGLSAVTAARVLLQSSRIAKVTLVDKAGAPGGRLNSRTYDSGTRLETGTRVFTATQEPFQKEVARWQAQGWVRPVDASDLRGLDGGRPWFEGAHGVGALMKELVKEVEQDKRISIRYDAQCVHPSPRSPIIPLVMTYSTEGTSVDAADFVIITAPLAQYLPLLPNSLPTDPSPAYDRILTLLLPTVQSTHLPVYARKPLAKLTALSTGVSKEGKRVGLVLQSTPALLGVAYERETSADDVVRAAFFAVLRESLKDDSPILDQEALERAASLTGRESQVKRWKFAQVSNSVDGPSSAARAQESRIRAMAGERIILAGDGTGGGGVEGAYLAGHEAAQHVLSAKL